MKLQAIKDDATDQNFRAVEREFPIQPGNLADDSKELFPQLVTPGTKKVNSGVAVLTFSASAFSNTVEVSHGIGAVPVVTLTGVKSGGTFVFPNLAEDPSSSVFKAQATVNGGTLNTTVKVHWIAIG